MAVLGGRGLGPAARVGEALPPPLASNHGFYVVHLNLTQCLCRLYLNKLTRRKR